MSTNTNNTPEANVGEILSRSEKFIEKYKKQIIAGVAAVILIVVAVLGVRHAYLLPKEREAEAAIFPGERYMASQQWDLALNGDSLNYIGFLSIIDDYGLTKTAKLAKVYAGICYYHKGEAEKALDYLKSFSADDPVIAPAIIGLTGDCYVEMNKVKEGIDYFNKAAQKADNEMLTPFYLKKAAVAYESLGEYKKALEAYNTIKTKYPASQEGTEVDKYIDRAQSLIK